MSTETKWADVAHYYLQSPIVLTDNNGTEYDRGVAVSYWKFSRLTPILWHRDDMTEEDAMALWKSVSNRVEFFESVYAAYGSPLVIYRSKFKALQPEEFHCAIQLGFDVFGLIESGQAIRKEAGNGL